MGKVPKPMMRVNRRDHAQAHGTAKKTVVVLHSTESHDRPGTSDIEGILKYLENKGYGVHFVVDGQGYMGQGAYENQIVYHAKGANTKGIGIEQIGYAKWTTLQWLFNPIGSGRRQRKQLLAVARLLAYLSDAHDIPLIESTTHGIARHSSFAAGGHTDPGKGYPMGYVLKHARRIQKELRNAT